MKEDATRALLFLAWLATTSSCYLSHQRAGEGSEDAGSPAEVVDAGPPEPESPLDTFCRELADAMCEVGEVCCAHTPDFDRLRCERRVLHDCRTRFAGAWVRDGVRSGLIVFDADAARRHLDGMRREGPSCDWSITWDRPGTLRDIITLHGAFNGTREPGETCSFLVPTDGYPTECARGYCAAELRECAEYVGRGERCGRNARCLDLDQPILPNPDAYDAILGLVPRYHPLVPSQRYGALLCEGGVCVDLHPVGAPCAFRDECVTERCVDGVCAARQPNGSRCEWWTDCQSGYCTGDPIWPGWCRAGDAPLGAPCVTRRACADDACIAGWGCVPPVCYEMEAYWFPD